MSSNYLGEIRSFGFGFVPRGWLACNGQLVSRNANAALFSLLNYTYGGAGDKFGLPNLSGRVPLHCGIVRQTMTTYTLGDAKGETGHVLTGDEITQHNHLLMASSGSADIAVSGQWPGPTVVLAQAQAAVAVGGQTTVALYGSGAATVTMSPASIVNNGTPHENQQPYLPLNFCIATSGIFPSRT
jgi:microcystin-dependent protein